MKTNITRNAFALIALSVLSAGLPAASHADKKGKNAPAASVPSVAPYRMRLTVAVNQFKVEEIKSDFNRLPADVREGLQSQLIEKLNACGNFIVMEREASARQSEDEEKAIDIKHRNHEPKGGAARAARQTRFAANYVITPTVIGFDPGKQETRRVGFPPFGYEETKQTATLTLNIRISNAQTGEIIVSKEAYGKQTEKHRGTDLNWKQFCYSDGKFSNNAPG